MTQETYTLNDGHSLPKVGLGTFQIRGYEGVEQILTAIQSGYRLLDTSTNYNNEGAVGEAIHRSGIPRSSFFVTTKLPGKYHRFEDALKMLEESLLRMKLDYVDLYLIHWPLPKQDNYVEAWEALVTAKKRSLVRSIGVSNFEEEHLKRIIQHTGVTPAVNQNEVHPYWPQNELVQVNRRYGILTEAWSPLGRGSKELEEPLLTKLAQKYGKNTGQIILRWQIERGILPIVKAVSPVHQRQNLDIFDFALTTEEIEQINQLQRPDGRVDGQDPKTYEEFE